MRITGYDIDIKTFTDCLQDEFILCKHISHVKLSETRFWRYDKC